jgi:GT2 family glycosyltransferase
VNVRTAAIVVNWNSWHELDRCLESLEKQTKEFHRIVVIDNASAVAIPDSIRRWRELQNIEFMFLQSNVGFARANNIGIQMVSECDLVALVNPDAFLTPEWHELMLMGLRNHPDSASFSSVLLMASDQACVDGLGDIYHVSGLVWRNGFGKKAVVGQQVEQEVFSPCAAAGFYRRQALLEANGFDEDYFCYVEDVDLGFRLRLLGYNSYLIPQAVALHVGSATTGGQHSEFSLYHGHRNLVWTFVKDMPGILFWLLLPVHLAMNFVTVVWFVLKGRGGVILRAKWDALRGLPAIWRKRKAVQRTRRCSIWVIWRILDKRVFIWK